MKYRSVLLKSLVLVLVFAVLLSVGISLLSYSNIGTRNSDDFSTPDINTNTVNAPLSQRQLQKKYNKYNTVTEENGKSVVTIFSEEQIADFNDRRERGEWFSISSEEALFLINDSIALFSDYDIIKIRGLDSTIKIYESNSETDSDHIYDTLTFIFDRIAVLNSASYNTLDIWAFYTDTTAECSINSPYNATVENLKQFPLSDQHETRQILESYPNYGVFVITFDGSWRYEERLYYFQDITKPFLQNMNKIYPS